MPITSPTDNQPFEAAGGPIGVVLSHGFTGMPGSMRPWGEALAAAGHTVSIPLLPGHGTTWQDANTTTWDQWYAELERAFDAVSASCTHTFIMGLSMGGTLVMRLAEQRGADVAGVVVVNGTLFSTRKAVKLLPLLRYVLPSLPPVGNDIKKPGVTEPAYERVPVKAMAELFRGMGMTKADVGKINQPLLVVTSRDDHVVETENSDYLMAHAGSTDKRHLWLEDSYHVATMDNELPLIIDESLSFIKAHS